MLASKDSANHGFLFPDSLLETGSIPGGRSERFEHGSSDVVITRKCAESALRKAGVELRSEEDADRGPSL